MKLGFTGTQSGMNEFQKKELIKVFDLKQPVEFHHGDCIGSDAEAHFMFIRWHLNNNHCDRLIIVHPPTNKGKAAFTWYKTNWPQALRDELEAAQYKVHINVREPFAYLARNQDIVKETEMLVATPKEIEHTLRSGTWTTIRYGWHSKKEVIIIPPIL